MEYVPIEYSCLHLRRMCRDYIARPSHYAPLITLSPAPLIITYHHDHHR